MCAVTQRTVVEHTVVASRGLPHSSPDTNRQPRSVVDSVSPIPDGTLIGLEG